MEPRFSYLHFLYATLLVDTLAAAPAAGANGIEARSLDWQELVPAGWEPPVIAPAYDKPTEQKVDKASLVKDLDGLQVMLPGFLRPVVFSNTIVSEFLLVPFLPHHMKQHAHLEPNQTVYVKLEEPVEITNPFSPMWVTGTLHLQTVATDEGPAGYTITDAGVSEYTY